MDRVWRKTSANEIGQQTERPDGHEINTDDHVKQSRNEQYEQARDQGDHGCSTIKLMVMDESPKEPRKRELPRLEAATNRRLSKSSRHSMVPMGR